MMSPDVEREYKRLIEEVEARFSARVRWDRNGGWQGLSFYEQWLVDLYQLRQRERMELGNVTERARVAGR